MYPDANPTAPGGMSKANLRLELKEKHGVSMDASREMSWPDLIQAVIDGRLARERETKAQAVAEVTAKRYGADVFSGPEEVEIDVYEYTGPSAGGDIADMFPGDDEDEEIEFAGSFDGVTSQPDPLPEDFDDTDEEVFDPEALFEEMVAARAAEEAANPPLFLGIPGIKDYVFDGHAGAGPSASERWMTCTMSLSASRAFLETLSPNQQRTYAGANTAARQGTTAHAVSEAKANHMLGRIEDEELETTLLELAVTPAEGEDYDDEMDEYTNEYVDLIGQYVDERGAENIRIESRVSASIPLDNLHEGEVYVVHGSADCIGLPTEDHPDLLVADLKYGSGIDVEVEENSQARIYALGALEELTDEDGVLTVDIETVTLVIAQPRLGGIKIWTESLDDLLDWRDDVLSPALTAALYGENEGATYNPSPKACQFCPARGRCPALAQERMEAAADLFEVIQETEFESGIGSFPETTSMSNEQLGSLLNQISGLVDLLPDLKEEAQRRLHRGEEIPGRWLVNYSPPRRWKPEDPHPALVKKIGGVKVKTLYKPPALMSPAQAEKVLGEGYKAIEDLVEKPDRRPVISTGPADRRSKWEGKPPEAMFDDERTPEEIEAASAREVEEMFPDE